MIPELFRIFSVPVSGYQFFYILGLVIGAATILLLSRREKLDAVEVAAFILLGIVCGWLGSRLLGSAFGQIARLGKQPLTFQALRQDFSTGGSFFGAVAASLLFAVLYSRAFFTKEYRRLWDIAVIGIALGHAVGRLGCFAAGCCFGIPTSLPWGVSFHSLGRDPHPWANVPLHPVQLYEASLVFANFVILILFRHKRRFPGEVFCFYLINYGLIRFFLEFLRHHGPGEMVWTGGLSWYQIFSLLLIMAGWLFRLRFQKTKNFPLY
jgi:phosphatidylglycerol:prolipoprotein diacylglycerol transferase